MRARCLGSASRVQRHVLDVQEIAASTLAKIRSDVAVLEIHIVERFQLPAVGVEHLKQVLVTVRCLAGVDSSSSRTPDLLNAVVGHVLDQADVEPGDEAMVHVGLVEQQLGFDERAHGGTLAQGGEDLNSKQHPVPGRPVGGQVTDQLTCDASGMRGAGGARSTERRAYVAEYDALRKEAVFLGGFRW